MAIELWSNPDSRHAPVVVVNREVDDCLTLLHGAHLGAITFTQIASRLTQTGRRGEVIGHRPEHTLKRHALLVATWSEDEGLKVLLPSMDPELDRFLGAAPVCEAYEGDFGWLVRRAAITSEPFAAELLLAGSNQQIRSLSEYDFLHFFQHSSPAIRQAAIRVAPRLRLAA